MRRYDSISSPLAALALLLLVCSFRYAAAARLLPTADGAKAAADGLLPTADGVKAAADGLLPTADGVKAAADGLVLREGNGDEVSEQTMGAAAEEEAACEEGNEECMQRRLLHDAHLDYIYTQHKGKP